MAHYKLSTTSTTRCQKKRLRYFTDGAVIGSKAFVNELFKGGRVKFTAKRNIQRHDRCGKVLDKTSFHSSSLPLKELLRKPYLPSSSELAFKVTDKIQG